uniref:radical SAM family heme chaperone HemW n=1 Tax=Agathobacter sp. TaxID=2021311 RepID=UPI0040559D6B
MKTPIQLYLHIPFCVKKCEYCDFLSFEADERTQWEYADALMREIYYYGSRMKDYEVSTIFIGGGTPSCLDERKLLQIMDALHRSFYIRTDAEVTIECNPGTLTEEKLQHYRKSGINRLSIGLQSADDEELKGLGRIHTYEQFLQTFAMAREAGFENINVDLISGIPYQTTEKFLSTLGKVVKLQPEHISAYSLIVEEGTPFFERYEGDRQRQEAGLDTEVLPTEEETYAILKATQEYLKEAGYEQYEISNFARPGYACRHNIGYWTREYYLGMGLGASSMMENVRFSNEIDLHKYMESTKNIQNKDFKQEEPRPVIATTMQKEAKRLLKPAQMEEFMFLGLRMNKGISKKTFEASFGTTAESVYGDVLDELSEKELLEVSEETIALTPRGMDMANYAMSRFLL